ncbi:MAG: lamin tail domain-containing protein [Candidatus Poribacteria bacterium]
MQTRNFITGKICVQLLALALLPLIIFSARAENKDIVINEIMYHPPNDLENLQYIELFNRGKTEVDISNWSFSKGVKYTFPPGRKVEPGDYVLVCRDIDAFQKTYGREITAFGNFSGRLSHRGETLQLSDSRKRVIDAVKYADREPWPVGADGYSSSLERISPFAESQRADNWLASKLPAKRTPRGTPGRQKCKFFIRTYINGRAGW